MSVGRLSDRHGFSARPVSVFRLLACPPKLASGVKLSRLITHGPTHGGVFWIRIESLTTCASRDGDECVRCPSACCCRGRRFRS